MSLVFNMLSRLVITFLPRSKCLLISWLQSPSEVIMELRKIKSATVSTVSASICHEVMCQMPVVSYDHNLEIKNIWINDWHMVKGGSISLSLLVLGLRDSWHIFILPGSHCGINPQEWYALFFTSFNVAWTLRSKNAYVSFSQHLCSFLSHALFWYQIGKRHW